MDQPNASFRVVWSPDFIKQLSVETKQRHAFTLEETAELERAWDDGMTSTKCRDHTSRVANSLGIHMERVNAWIGNKKGKLKRGGQDDRSKTKQSAMSRGPTAFTLFSEGKKRGNQTAGSYFTSLSRDWACVSSEDKNKYRARAQEMRQHPDLGREKEVAINAYKRTLSLTCDKLAKLGVESGGITCGVDSNSPPAVFGSLKAHNFFSPQKESFFVSIQAANSHMVPKNYIQSAKSDPQEEKTRLRGKVRKLFNTCWVEAGGKGRCVPYKEVLPRGCLEVSGLPCPFKDPSNMGISVLREILECGSSIQFRINPMYMSAVSTSGNKMQPISDVSQSVHSPRDSELDLDVDTDTVGVSDVSQSVHSPRDYELDLTVDTDTVGVSDDLQSTGSVGDKNISTNVPSSEYRSKRLFKRRRRKRKMEKEEDGVPG